MKRFYVVLFAFVFLFACAERKVATKPEDQTKPEAKQESQVKQEPAQETIKPSEPERIEEASKQMTEEQPAAAVKAAEMPVDIHFDFDKYDIREQDKPELKRLADRATGDMQIKLVIEGHCDERGTNVYNLGLGERRADAVKSYLLTLGVPSSRIQTVSYGEERPLCTEHTEECWQQNRRAHFETAEK